MTTPKRLLKTWIERQVDCTWLDEQIISLRQSSSVRQTLFRAVGLVPRKLGKADLKLTDTDFTNAATSSAGWDPTGYSIDMAARLVLLLEASQHRELFETTFDMLWRTADVGEQVAFYRGLPLYPNASHYLWRATDGCRTNIKAVFEAIAHRNPYPAKHFDEVAFNQLCLKALFVGSNLYLVQGLDSRLNAALSRMMTDYAFERWAASRAIYPELWRSVASHPDERCISALNRALASEDRITATAAALACSTSQDTAAQHCLAASPSRVQALLDDKPNWEDLAHQFLASQS
ncbi:MAG: EboA domain-containing protein [Myxococcota bacterium]|nr:EboA domain-containing protein [Myxococcota bacterium]